MNCKQGDLAVIVGSDDEFCRIDIGKVVEVVEPGDDWSDAGDTRPHWACRTVNGGPLAVSLAADGITTIFGFEAFCDIADQHLRPIRTGDVRHEAMSRAGKPEKVAA